LYFLRDQLETDPNFINKHQNDLAASFERTVVEILMQKLDRAVRETGIRHVALSGGVSANTALRQAFIDRQERKGWTVYIPPFAYTTDNAAMIAQAGYYKAQSKDFCPLDKPAFARTTI
ncbi:MAG: tRNA (adenosine(37)-N6)-threonylcarbamoyltransferase complex transferase subunit TsaD, partial [Bacteroidaceae bacterium]|nr:tRNA (adenosine(37)-N6)-threonylcarbamoyltransferase complex transferase subunit TsaD [Bacteroidaceae bacterium]